MHTLPKCNFFTFSFNSFKVAIGIYHNYVKSHMRLKGKVPADTAGIEIQGKNKWKTIKENPSMSRKATSKNEEGSCPYSLTVLVVT